MSLVNFLEKRNLSESHTIIYNGFCLINISLNSDFFKTIYITKTILNAIAKVLLLYSYSRRTPLYAKINKSVNT